MEFVDRSVDPNYPLVYGIPYEDTDLTADEVEGSRTHQFFALCRQTFLHEDLPQWITMADVEATVRNYEDFVTPPQDDIFEFASDWDGCWHRISEDSARRPITDAMASQPVNWDSSTVPAGVYLLLGYTYEPPFNLWTPRAGGVVRVHDGGDPAAGGPAAAITTGQQSMCVGDTIGIEGCVNALPGTTMTALYTTNPSPSASESTWVPFAEAENVPVEGDQFTLDLDVPPQAAGTSTVLRVDFTDPNGMTYTAYQYETVIVLPDESATCADEPVDCTGAGIMDPSCESTADALPEDTGGCRVQGTPPGGWGALGLLGLAALWRAAKSNPEGMFLQRAAYAADGQSDGYSAQEDRQGRVLLRDRSRRASSVQVRPQTTDPGRDPVLPGGRTRKASQRRQDRALRVCLHEQPLSSARA